MAMLPGWLTHQHATLPTEPTLPPHRPHLKECFQLLHVVRGVAAVRLQQHVEGCIAVERVGGTFQVLLHDLTSVEESVESGRLH